MSNVVFVLGAGASKHVGYPTGEQLLKEIIKDNSRYARWSDHEYINLEKFQKSLKFSGLLSVDSFLEQSPSFEELGKAMIAVHLARKENESWPFVISEKDRDIHSESDDKNWYRELWRRLVLHREKLTDGTISFITFNYDRSFEFFLENAFKHSYYGEIDPLFRTDKLYLELKKIKIIHLYGQVGYLPWQRPENEPNIFERPYEQFVGNNEAVFWEIGKKIKLIRNNDIADSPEFTQARELLKNASYIYFLGFGYDPVNVSRLGRHSQEFKSDQEIAGTAIGLGEAEIQRIKDTFYPQIHSRVRDFPEKFPKIKIYEFLKEKIDWRVF